MKPYNVMPNKYWKITITIKVQQYKLFRHALFFILVDGVRDIEYCILHMNCESYSSDSSTWNNNNNNNKKPIMKDDILSSAEHLDTINKVCATIVAVI